MNLTGKNPTFRRHTPASNPYRIFGIFFLLVLSLFLLRAVQKKQILSPFAPTPVPTRSSQSYTSEGETYFVAGNLPAAIQAYQKAAEVDPQNANVRAELARMRSLLIGELRLDA